MMTQSTLGLSSHLTFKGNLKDTRYGWLRLTPAYSVHFVSALLDNHQGKNPVVLDPFCGTGTTMLVCAERGIESETTDINPFLLWLAQAKTRSYKAEDVDAFKNAALYVEEKMLDTEAQATWVPPLFQIEKWWDGQTIETLSRTVGAIKTYEDSAPKNVSDLLKVAFCRLLIERANVSFGHQSMSFKKNGSDNKQLFSENEAVLNLEARS